ncbi:hypothetical protein MJO28_009369, partial [Puccinia striiformis f. sp. tritici]
LYNSSSLSTSAWQHSTSVHRFLSLLISLSSLRPLDHSITIFTGLSDIRSPPSFGLGVLVAQIDCLFPSYPSTHHSITTFSPDSTARLYIASYRSSSPCRLSDRSTSRPLNHNIHGVIGYTITAFLRSWRSCGSGEPFQMLNPSENSIITEELTYHICSCPPRSFPSSWQYLISAYTLF